MYVRGQCVRAMETASIRDTQKGRQGRMSRGARRTRGREGILRMGGVFFYMVVLVWRLFGRGAQGSACLDFSLSLRTGTLIRIGPGSYPGKGGVLSDHYLRKKKEKGGERSKKERRTAVAQQEMLTASLIYMQVQGEWGGLIPFPISMLNAGQGSWWEWEALFAPCCSSPSPLHQYLPLFLCGIKKRGWHCFNNFNLDLKSIWTSQGLYVAIYFVQSVYCNQPS